MLSNARPKPLVLFAMLFVSSVLAAHVAPAAPSGPANLATDPARVAVDRLVADYIGLYAGPTIDRWRTLFHPAVVVAYPDDDGSIRTRTLDEFVARQKNYFATGRQISERLENVRIDMGRRIARVSADFIFLDQEKERLGKLGLHLAEGKDGWKIVAVLFSYDAERIAANAYRQKELPI
jgi:Putative lumazine-binding